MGHEVAHAIAGNHAREKNVSGMVANGLMGGVSGRKVGENPNLTQTIFFTSRWFREVR